MSASEIVHLDINDLRWMDLVQSDAHAILFHHPSWIQLVSEAYHYQPEIVGMIDEQGKLIAGLPIVKVKTLSQKSKWISLPYTDHCRPLGMDEPALRSVTNELQEACLLKKDLSIELRWDYPAVGEKATLFYLHRLGLSPNEDEVANRISPKYFRQIKVAYQRGITIQMGTSLDDMRAFYALHMQTRQRKGVPVQPWQFFERLQKEILSRGYGFVVLAYFGKQCVAGSVFLNFKETLIYKYSASIELARTLLAMDPILWTAISWGCDHGYRYLDMGRTEIENTGLMHFKERWGAERIPLTYTFIGSSMQQAGSSRWMPMVETVLKHSPVWVTRLAGELFYRYSN